MATWYSLFCAWLFLYGTALVRCGVVINYDTMKRLIDKVERQEVRIQNMETALTQKHDRIDYLQGELADIKLRITPDKGLAEPSRPNQGQTVSNRPFQRQTYPNRPNQRQSGPNRINQQQTDPNGTKQGQAGSNRPNQQQTDPNGTKQGQAGSNRPNQRQRGPNRTNQEQTSQNRTKQGQTGPNKSNQIHTGLIWPLNIHSGPDWSHNENRSDRLLKGNGKLDKSEPRYPGNNDGVNDNLLHQQGVHPVSEQSQVLPKTGRQIIEKANQSSTTNVAFSVSVQNSTVLYMHMAVPYGSVGLDIGGGFRPKLGLYCVPVGGVYVFTWTTFTANPGADTHRFTAKLEVNGETRGTTETVSTGSDGYSSTTGLVVTAVNTGDMVYIQTVLGGNIRSDADAKSTFSGWRLF